MKKRVVVGMSGGVDSAVAAYLLKESGFDVLGVILRTWLSVPGTESRCCEISDAKRMAEEMDIPFRVEPAVSEFRRRVLAPFVDEYLDGRTPNPCVECNRAVKWEGLLRAADAVGADFAATGHYAYVRRLRGGRYAVGEAASPEKDQSYMLCRLTQKQLSRTLLPLGPYTKEEVRSIAAKAHLSAAEKPDSQEICFVTDGSYADVIEREAKDLTPPPGDFVDINGRILGRHKGIIHYTVGQRKGLGIALGYPAYVSAIRAETNQVVIGDERSVRRIQLICGDINLMGAKEIPRKKFLRAFVKIRYHHPKAAALLIMLDENSLGIYFEKPVKAPAPGQSAVCYDEDGNILCCGKIRHTL